MRQELGEVGIVAQELKDLLHGRMNGDGLLNMNSASGANPQQFAHVHVCQRPSDQPQSREAGDSPDTTPTAKQRQRAAPYAHGEARRGSPAGCHDSSLGCCLLNSGDVLGPLMSSEFVAHRSDLPNGSDRGEKVFELRFENGSAQIDDAIAGADLHEMWKRDHAADSGANLFDQHFVRNATQR